MTFPEDICRGQEPAQGAKDARDGNDRHHFRVRANSNEHEHEDRDHHGGQSRPSQRQDPRLGLVRCESRVIRACRRKISEDSPKLLSRLRGQSGPQPLFKLLAVQRATRKVTCEQIGAGLAFLVSNAALGTPPAPRISTTASAGTAKLTGHNTTTIRADHDVVGGAGAVSSATSSRIPNAAVSRSGDSWNGRGRQTPSSRPTGPSSTRSREPVPTTPAWTRPRCCSSSWRWCRPGRTPPRRLRHREAAISPSSGRPSSKRFVD